MGAARRRRGARVPVRIPAAGDRGARPGEPARYLQELWGEQRAPGGVDDARADPRPRSGTRAVVGRVLDRGDGEHDVVGGDRLAVVPARIRPQVEDPRRPVRQRRPRSGERRARITLGVEGDEPFEDERDEIAIGLGPGRQWIDRGRPTQDALGVGGHGRG